jgi:hypothetical protein
LLAVAHHSLGSGYVLKGMDAQARLAFMRALELEPELRRRNAQFVHFPFRNILSEKPHVDS